MSNEAINWAFNQQIPMTRKFVLIVLANYADESHSCFPGQKKIAEKIGASVETVRRALCELEKDGFIVRERRNRESGYRSSDRYFLPVSLPTGQFACKAESGVLPVNLPTPTGQSERANYTLVNPLGDTSVKTKALAKPDAPQQPCDRIAKRSYDATDGALKYVAIRAVAKWATEKKHAPESEIENAVAELYRMGKPVTNTTVGQFLDGHIKPTNQPQTTKDKMLSTLDLGRRLQEARNAS